MVPQIIIAIASSVTALGVLLLSYQIWSDHERSRREQAILVLNHWAINLTKNSSAARKFAESLNWEQSKSLFEHQSFKIQESQYDLFLGSLPPMLSKERGADPPQNEIVVSVPESIEIRWAVISYLNHLETALTAARNSVADEKMIYEQFTFLVAPSEGHFILQDFRKVGGGKAVFPSIEKFIVDLELEHKGTLTGKSKIA